MVKSLSTSAACDVFAAFLGGLFSPARSPEIGVDDSAACEVELSDPELELVSAICVGNNEQFPVVVATTNYELD